MSDKKQAKRRSSEELLPCPFCGSEGEFHRTQIYIDDFMSDIYDELKEDSDNFRANRIIDRFDTAIEIVEEVGGVND